MGYGIWDMVGWELWAWQPARQTGDKNGAQTARHQRAPGHRPDRYQQLLQVQGFSVSSVQALRESALPWAPCRKQERLFLSPGIQE